MPAPEWKAVAIVAEGDRTEIDGLNPWKYAWKHVPEAVLPHPSYSGHGNRMNVYRISGEGRQVEFAAAEVSPGGWAFYVRNV